MKTHHAYEYKGKYMNIATAKSKFLISALCFSLPIAAFAAPPEIHGFFRAGAAISLDEQTYQGADKNGDFGSTHFGLNFSNNIDSNWRVASQIYAAGYEDNFGLHIDWAYATFQAAEGLNLNFGKIKYPNLLYSEIVDVGNIYPWTAPPQELYNAETEGNAYLFMESFSGASAVYSMFAGEYEITTQVLVGNGGVEMGSLDKMLGGALNISSDIATLKVGYNQYTPDQVEAGELGLDGNTVNVVSAGIIVNWNNALIISEYANGTVDGQSERDSTAMYTTLGYTIGSVTPHVTYSILDAEEGRDVLGLGVKYQASPSTTVKMDYYNISPEAEDGEESESFGVIRGALDFVF